MEPIISIILIGKSFLLKAGLEAFLSEFAYVSVAATFEGTEPALDKKIIGLKPDIVIVNPNVQEQELTQLLQSISKESSITIMGFVSGSLPSNIIGKFSEVLSINMDKMTLTRILNKVLFEKGRRVVPKDTDHKLSERETDVLKHIAYGLTNMEIADRLFLSVHTITTHRKHITKKLGIKSVSGLTVYALMNKLVSPLEVEKKGQPRF